MGPEFAGDCGLDEKDFIEVYGEVINYNGNLQINIKQIRKAGEEEYNPADYMPTTEKSVDGMYEQLTEFIRHISNPYLKSLLEYFFVNDQEFIKNSGHILQRKRYTTDFREDCWNIR